jgi:hypothetical protein
MLLLLHNLSNSSRHSYICCYSYIINLTAVDTAYCYIKYLTAKDNVMYEMVVLVLKTVSCIILAWSYNFSVTDFDV